MDITVVNRKTLIFGKIVFLSIFDLLISNRVRQNYKLDIILVYVCKPVYQVHVWIFDLNLYILSED